MVNLKKQSSETMDEFIKRISLLQIELIKDAVKNKADINAINKFMYAYPSDSKYVNDYFGYLAQRMNEITIDKKGTIAEEHKDEQQVINEIVYGYAPFRQYVDAYVHTIYKTYYYQHKDELINSAYQEFAINFYKYDSSKAALNTFAKLHLLHGSQLYIAFIENKHSVFEKEIAKNVEIVKNNLKKSGFTEDQITASIVSSYLPKYSYLQIEACLNGGHTVQAIEDVNMEVLGPKQGSAESEYIKQMYEEDARSILKALPKYEVYLLQSFDADKSSPRGYKSFEYDEFFLNLLKECGKTSSIKVDKQGREYVTGTDIKKMFGTARAHLFHVALTKNNQYHQNKINKRDKINDSIDFNLYEKAVENEAYLFDEFKDKPL